MSIQQRPEIKTWANLVTVARVLIAPFMLVLIPDDRAGSWAAFALWFVLCLSDGIDGHLARRHGATNLGAFITVALITERLGSERIEDFAGLLKRAPGPALVLSLCLVSLTGIPPTAGFIGKWYIFNAAVQEHLIALAVLGVLTSVVSVFFYLSRNVAYIRLAGRISGAMEDHGNPSTRFRLDIRLSPPGETERRVLESAFHELDRYIRSLDMPDSRNMPLDDRLAAFQLYPRLLPFRGRRHLIKYSVELIGGA